MRGVVMMLALRFQEFKLTSQEEERAKQTSVTHQRMQGLVSLAPLNIVSAIAEVIVPFSRLSASSVMKSIVLSAESVDLSSISSRLHRLTIAAQQNHLR